MADYKIKKKSWAWKLVPFAGRNRFSTTIGDTIYLTPKRFADWESGNPKGSTIALIEHERVHVDQWRRDKNFQRRYVTSRTWRFRYECEAYARQAHVRVNLDKQKRGRHYFVDRYARTLSSPAYMLFMSYDTIYEAIDRGYEKLEAN